MSGRGPLTRPVWLIDLDGTLVDSASAHEAAFRDALEQVAPRLLASFRYADYAGVSTREAAARLGLRGALADRLVRRKQRLYRAHATAGKVAALPGAHQLLDTLTALGRTAYLVTGGSAGSVREVMTVCGLDRFDGVLTADDVPWSKPDSRFYLEACHRWAVSPRDAVAVEDSPHGVAAALSAGIATLQVHGRQAVPGATGARDLKEIVAMLAEQAVRA